MLNQSIFIDAASILSLNNGATNGSSLIYDITGNATIVNSGATFSNSNLCNGVNSISVNNKTIVATSVDIATADYSGGITFDVAWKPAADIVDTHFFAWGAYNGMTTSDGTSIIDPTKALYVAYFKSSGTFAIVSDNVTRATAAVALSSLTGQFNRVTMMFKLTAAGGLNECNLYLNKTLKASATAINGANVLPGKNMSLMSNPGNALNADFFSDLSFSKGYAYPY